MGPETTMFSQTSSTNSDSTLLAVPKLRDDGSNWSDYHPRIQNAMGAKGLWRHVLGTATAPVPYVVTEGIPMLSDGKTPATEDQIEAKESKIIEFEKREYLARHILLSTTSTRLGAKIKDLSTAEAMWKVVTDDATSKSTLYLGCNTGHTAGDFVLYRTCHLSHRTRYRCGVHRYRFELRVWLRHRGINIPRYTVYC